MRSFWQRKHIIFGTLAAVLTAGLVVSALIPDGGQDEESDQKRKYLDKPNSGSYSLVDDSCEAVDWAPLRDAGIKDGVPDSHYTPPISDSTNVKCSLVDTTNKSKRYAYIVAKLFDSPAEAAKGFDESVQKVEDLGSLATVANLKGKWEKGLGVAIAGKQDDFVTTKGAIRDSNLVLEFKSVIAHSSSAGRDDVRNQSLHNVTAVSADLMAGLE